MILKEVFMATPHLIKLSAAKMWVDYDSEADVLYIGENETVIVQH